MGNHLTEVYRPLVSLCERLNQLDIPWLVGGSTSCLLQKVGLDRKPNDLDVYTDCRYLDQIEPFLLDWCIEPVQYSQTERYESYLGRYRIHLTETELVANLTVRMANGRYDVEVGALLRRYAPTVEIGTERIPLMPLEHELIFNLLRGREDRYVPIAETVRQRGVDELLWQQLQERNALSLDFWKRASALIGLSRRMGERLG